MEENNKNFFIQVVKGIGIYIISVLVGILLFALIIKLFNLNEVVIKPVNQFIKAISLFAGCFFSLKSNRGLLKGLIIGIFGTIIIYLIFSIFSGNLVFNISFLIDMAFGIVFGIIAGILTVNIKKDN